MTRNRKETCAYQKHLVVVGEDGVLDLPYNGDLAGSLGAELVDGTSSLVGVVTKTSLVDVVAETSLGVVTETSLGVVTETSVVTEAGLVGVVSKAGLGVVSKASLVTKTGLVVVAETSIAGLVGASLVSASLVGTGGSVGGVISNHGQLGGAGSLVLACSE